MARTNCSTTSITSTASTKSSSPAPRAESGPDPVALGDALMIDGLIVNGSARLVGWFSGIARHVQTGYLNHYAFAMISGLILLLGWVVLG